MKVARWGNSLAVRIPKDVAEALGLAEGSEIDLFPVDGGIGVARRLTREAALAGLRQFRGTLPEGFRFDRDEANAR